MRSVFDFITYARSVKENNSLKKIIVSFISAAIVLSAAPRVYAENVLTKTAASESYGIEAKRIEYIGDKAAFSIDIPSERADAAELSESEIINKDDGSSECDLFYGETEKGYISCVFHQSSGGFAAEAESWSEIDNTTVYNGVSADGQPYCVAEMDMYGFSAFLVEFPIDEETWVNITMSFPESEMDAVRDDIISMIGTLTLINDSVSIDESAENNYENPKTGESAMPIAVAVLMIASAAVLLKSINFNADKRHKI